MKILEDGAQGFGGELHGEKACSFGDIATTSFFPAKPLGCYGDGGAVFTDDDIEAKLLKSLRVHGKGKDKYDNVRLGMNSRLDTIQAAALQVKLKAFREYELTDVNTVADRYAELLRGVVKIPSVADGFLSSWAQYSILLKDKEQRDGLQSFLKDNGMTYHDLLPKADAQTDCICEYKMCLHRLVGYREYLRQSPFPAGTSVFDAGRPGHCSGSNKGLFMTGNKRTEDESDEVCTDWLRQDFNKSCEGCCEQ